MKYTYFPMKGFSTFIFFTLILLVLLSHLQQQSQLLCSAMEYNEELKRDEGANFNVTHDLEEQAKALLVPSRRLMRSADAVHSQLGLDQAEAALRHAVTIAPWLAMPHSKLARFLMDHHSTRRSTTTTTTTTDSTFKQVMHHFRTAMHLTNAPGLPLGRIPKTTYPGRLKHDRDQLELLASRGKLPQDLVDTLIRDYDGILQDISLEQFSQEMQIDDEFWRSPIGSTYDRALYVPEMEPLKGPALNPNLDFALIEKDFLSSYPHVTVFDNLLTDEALLKLRQYYEEATIFWDSIGPGYVGSYIDDGGFGNSVLEQLLTELVHAFPKIICSHKLTTAWAYKYDSDVADPIATHADEAAVNFNFWVSPDEGNLDPWTGGLVVYKAIPPEGTPRNVFNQYPLHDDVLEMLDATDHANYTVPYKTNRAVVFQSNLFHESGPMNWAPGYTKRRLNLTLLWGKMYGKCEESGNSSNQNENEEQEL